MLVRLKLRRRACRPRAGVHELMGAMSERASVCVTRVIAFVISPLVMSACAPPDGGPADQAVCTTCSIVLQEVATIGHDSDPTGPTEQSIIVMDPAGSFYVTNTYTFGEIAVYDSAGHYSRSFGRRGRGPGEFNSSLGVATAGDTLLVIGAFRLSAMTTGGKLLYTRPIATAENRFVRLRNGAIVVNSPPRYGTKAARPLRMIHPDGSTRDFGPVPTQDAASRSNIMLWLWQMGPGLEGRLWATSSLTGEVGLWSADADLLRSFRMRHAWFAKPDPRSLMSRQEIREDHNAQVFGVWETHDGLWISTSVSEASATREPDRKGVLEVLEPRTGRLITRLDRELPLLFLNDSIAYDMMQVDTTNEVVVRVYRYHLRRGGSTAP